MYKHILINSAFNTVYSLIMMVKLVNTCIFDNGSVFCSSIYQNNSVQYFKIIVIFYFGSVFKFCSNFSYLSFTFSRFILVSNLKEKSIFKRFTNIKLRNYLMLLTIISCLLNLYIIFQYKLNLKRDPHRYIDFPYEVRDETYCQIFKCNFFNGMKILNKFLNDILIVILIMIVDVMLLRNFNKHLEHKCLQITDPENHNSIQKSRKNVNRMIIINGVIYSLAHVPEFFSTTLLIGFARKISRFFKVRLSCDLVNEEAQFFNLISIIGQFFIFVKYKKNFRTSLKDLLGRAYLSIGNCFLYTSYRSKNDIIKENPSTFLF